MTTVGHPRRQVRSSRAIVGRDTITILGGALLAVMAGNLAGFGGPVGDLSSPTPDDSSTIIGVGSLPPHPTFAPFETLGPIVNPTVGFEATPTPIPIITLGPSQSPSPSPTPSASVKPSIKPSPKPTPKPTPTQTTGVAAFTCVVTNLTLDCTDLSTNATSWDWDWGDGTHTLAGGSQSHTYAQAGTFPVILSVTPIGPKSSASHNFAVTEPPPTP